MAKEWVMPEQRRESPELLGYVETPHKSRKDTKRWCGGHEGREHIVVLQEDKNLASMTAWVCHWTMHYIRGREPKFSYLCRHERGCTVCGKIIARYIAATDCPHYRPAPPTVKDSTCECQHPHKEHEPAVRWKTRCLHEGCDCKRFSWMGFV